ncbi:hypothetical protein NSK_008431 [Nannochloropsis salina CCMP1776]|uniref:ADP/ATP translocase n=1 Tax=Nannochloropsis salina CCMP1776 TaxID=1027361 RepID=A0A4D9CUG8_9STRA|nr:hypothetical protein NSK_008431 [Nannochloropsis salina CCMP1776]|eukprot:TFJ80288.1 hypothetical protein NSK_008431 [Nannochloropsis salina CCMP1776]
MDPILFLSRVLELQECPSSCSVSPFPSGERGNCTGQQDPQLVDEKHPTGSNEVAQSAVLKLASELLHHEPGFLEGAVEKAPGKAEREAGDTEDWWEDVRRGCRSALYGGVSGGAARVAVYPLDTLKRRMQAQVLHLLPPSARTEAAGLTHRFRSSRECLRHMVREEGFSALYKGMIPTLLKSVSSTAIIFGVYEALKRRFLLGPGQ